MACGPNQQSNVDKALSLVKEASRRGAEIICLLELFASRYPCQSEDHRRFDEAEPIPGPITALLAAAAKQHSVVLVASLFERRAAGVYHNTAVVFDVDGTLAGKYRKMHIPDDPLYYEKFYFTPGDLGFSAFPTQRGTIGVCICWDQWFPEAARLTALSGADVICYPTAIGWSSEDKQTCGFEQVDAWQTMMRSHAIANGVFVVAANRVGVEDQLEFWGSSFIADPNGKVNSVASVEREETLMAVCDWRQVDAVRTHWPFLRDRRIDAYDGLLKRMRDDD